MTIVGTLDEIMTKLELIKIVEKSLVDYYIDGMSASISRNTHLTGIEGREFAKSTEQGILVDVINNIALFQGVDYGMNVGDFLEEVEKARKNRIEQHKNTSEQIVKNKPDDMLELKF
jgi:hypothetical protein